MPFKLTKTTPASFPSSRSVLFNGTNQYLSIPYNSNLWLDSSNWTIECWVYLNSLSTYNNIWAHGYGAPNTIRSIVVYMETTTGLLRIAQSPDGSTNYDTSLGITLTTNSWKHVAIVRNGANVTAYLNGTAGTSVTAYNLYNSTTVGHFIGIQGDLQSITAYNGYISNHRVVKGTAVYTSSFTPPTAPLTAIANTSLLTCNAATIVDSSTNNFTITNNGSATVSSVVPFNAVGYGYKFKNVSNAASVFAGTQKAIFGYGSFADNLSITNIVSNAGVVANDTTGVGTARTFLAAAGYGTDKAIFGYGTSGANTAITNLVSNTGVVATDTAGVGSARVFLAAAGYGTDKAIFGYGEISISVSMSNRVSNTGVVSTDTTGVGTARNGLAAAGYGGDKAIFGYGVGSPVYSLTNRVSNTGVVATDTAGVGTARGALGAACYGVDKAIFGYGSGTIINLVSNTGVVATDTAGAGTGRGGVAAASYNIDKAIFGYGYTTTYVSMTNLVSNTGVVATDTTGVGTARYLLAAAGYSTSAPVIISTMRVSKIYADPTLITNGLVLYLDASNASSYPGSGTTWTDLSGNSNTGTLTNGPTFSSANGGSIVFDGTNDSVVTNTAVDNTLNTCTFSAWIRRTDLTNQVGIFNSYTTGDSGFGFDSSYAGVGDINFSYIYLNGGNYIGRYTNANAILANNWYHVVGTWDGTFSPSGIKIYINGIRSDSTSQSGGSVTAYAQSGYAMRIGSSYWSNAERGFFNGNIAQTLIYNRELSASEVLQNYNVTKTRFGL